MSNNLANPRADDSQSAASSVPGRRPELLRSLCAHATIAAAVFLVVAALGGLFAWKKGAPKYQAEAVVVISPRFLKNLSDDREFDLQSNTQYREFVQQNVRTVNRYDIMEESVRRLDAGTSPYRERGESQPAAVNRLQSSLKVSPVPDTYQITIGLDGDSPKGLDEVVNTVMAVFLEKSKDEEFYGRDQRLGNLRDEANKLRAEIAAMSGEKDRLAQDLEVSTFSENFANPFDRLVVGSREALAVARQRRIASDAQLAAIQSRGDASASALTAYAREMTQKDAELTTMEANLSLRRGDLLAKLNAMLPSHPGRVEIESELREMDGQLSKTRESLTAGYATMLLAQRSAEAAAARQAESQMQNELEAQAKQAAWYSSNYQKGLNISYAMERDRKRLEQTEDRVSFITLESQAPGFAHVFSPARPSAVAFSGGRKKLSLIVMAAALLLGLAVPVAIDMLDPHLRSANESQKLLGFPPLGYTFDPLRVEPTEVSDRMRRLAAAIERDAERNRSRTFLFLPVNQQAGLEALLVSLARELERLGHRVRVISSARQPVPSPETEATESLRVQVAAIASGLVLIAAPPLADDAEGELLAASCDVVVLAVLAGITTKSELRSAARTLERIQPRAVSVVVTGYDPHPPMPPLKIGPFSLARLTERTGRTRAKKEGEL